MTAQRPFDLAAWKEYDRRYAQADDLCRLGLAAAVVGWIIFWTAVALHTTPEMFVAIGLTAVGHGIFGFGMQRRAQARLDETRHRIESGYRP